MTHAAFQCMPDFWQISYDVMHTNTNCTKVFTQRKKCTLLAEGIALSEDEDEFDQAAAAANAAAADGDGDGGDGDGDGAEWEARDAP